MLIPIQTQYHNVKLGRSKATVPRFGCLVCTLSMLSELFFCYQDVPMVASHPWYALNGDLIWQSVAFPNFRFVQRIRVRNDVVVRSALANPNGGVALNCWNGKHWILALKPVQTRRGTDFLCADPLTGRTCLALATYGNITGSALFERKI